MSVWSVRGDEVWYSGWRAKNYLSCITDLVGPQDLEVKRLFNVQFFSRWSIDSCCTWRPPTPPTTSTTTTLALLIFHICTCSVFCFRIRAPAAVDLDDSGSFPIQGSLQLSRALTPPPSLPPLHPLRLSHHPRTASPLTPSLLLPGPCLGH